MESDNAEARVDGQEQTSVVQQNQTQTSENDRQRDTDLRSVELRPAETMDMMQIGLMFREMIETQSRLEESMKEMENRLKDSQKEIKDEFKNIRVETQRNLERLEHNITSPERRLNKDFSSVDHICCGEKDLENRIEPLEQECIKNSHIKNEETQKGIVEDIIEEENQISIEKSQNEYLNKRQTNAEENRRESEDVMENIIVKNRVIIEE